MPKRRREGAGGCMQKDKGPVAADCEARTCAMKPQHKCQCCWHRPSQLTFRWNPLKPGYTNYAKKRGVLIGLRWELQNKKNLTVTNVTVQTGLECQIRVRTGGFWSIGFDALGGGTKRPLKIRPKRLWHALGNVIKKYWKFALTMKKNRSKTHT